MTRMIRRVRLAAAGAAVTAVLALTGCSTMLDLADEAGGFLDEVTGGGSSNTAEAPADATAFEGDYFTIVGTAERTYEPANPGEVFYCDLDELERATCAYGELTGEQRDAAQARGREDITVDPAGWAHNGETTIPALEGVEGSSEYSGWFWNRSHLVADSLGGSPDAVNLVTGTRTQNVGSTHVDGQFAGGMAYTELKARDYLDSAAADSCPLYYAATPEYSGDELIPRSVVVDIQSCDLTIDERVRVANTANGFNINYATGEWAPVE